jgi:large repetitive protein
MNKRGIIKLGAGILVLLLVLVLVFSSLFSSAEVKKSYIVGEEFKMDLSQYAPCNLKIKTPSTTFVQSNCDDKFSLKLGETGDYVIDIKSRDALERIEFQAYPKQETEEGHIILFNFTTGNTYLINNTLKFDMNSFGNYELIIFTPSGKRISRVASNDIFLFSLTEEGVYNVNFERGNGITKYKFEVVYQYKQDLIQKKAEINKPVEWSQVIDNSKSNKDNNFIEIPNVTDLTLENANGEPFTGYTLTSIEGKNYIQINKNLSEPIKIDYFTEAPFIEETTISENKKEIIVSSPSDLHYENVMSYTQLPKEILDKSLIKVYWKENNSYLNFEAYDKDGNGLLDYIEWVVPHLSNQTFEIIIITKAEHLSSSKTFISDIYSQIRKLDNIWSEIIPANDYVRITFEKNLTSNNDITIYPRIISGNPIVEVYQKDSTTKIAEFNPVISNDYNKVLLNSLIGQQDTFDLKVVGGSVEFDYIVDPLAVYNSTFGTPTCSSTDSPCIANSSLLRCVGSQASPGPEPNAPNSIDACADAPTSGTCYTDESVENITLTDLDGSTFAGGDTVTATVSWYCYGTMDRVALYYTSSTSSINWQNELVGTTACPAAGYYTRNITFNLDTNSGQHAVRAIMLYNADIGSACTTGSYRDQDDLVFLVAASNTSTSYYDMNPDYRAYWGQPASSNLWLAGTNATIGQYNNMKSGNSVYASSMVTLGNGYYPFWRFNFTVNEEVGQIDSLGIRFTGYSNSSNANEPATLYIYNVNSTWMTLGTVPKTTNTNVTANIINGIGSYINKSNHQVLLAVEGTAFDTGEALVVDHVRITVQYTPDTTSPTYEDIEINNTDAGQINKFSINISDDLALENNGGYIFSTNNTGSWVNDSTILFTTTPSWANVTKILNLTIGKVIGYMWYFNDTSGNKNATSIYTLTTTDGYPPTFTTIPANSSLFYGNQSLLVKFIGTDETGFGYYRVNDTRFSINQTGFLSNATPMAVGTYVINVTINDSSNNLNWTFYRVQINKSNYFDCGVYFNTTTPQVYPNNFIVYTNCSSAYTLYRNGTSISNASTINGGAGYYNLTVQRTDTINYTNTVMSQFFTINKNTEKCMIFFNESTPLSYPRPFLVWANCTTSFVLARNGTTIANYSTQNLVGGAYNFSMSRNDSSNYTIIFNQSQFRVNPDSTPPYFTTIPSNASLFYSNQSLLVTFSAADGVAFGYYRVNDTRFSINQTGFLSNATPMAVGTYVINVTINDSSNNLNWTFYRVQINKSNYFDCGVYFNTTTPQVYPNNFVVYTNCSSAYTLYRNGTSISNSSTINGGVGYYNLTVQRTDTINYTNTVMSQFFTVNKNTENCRVLFNTTSPITLPDTFLVWANCTSAFVLARNGTTISNNSVQSLSVGAYNFSFSRNDSFNYTTIFNQSQFIVNAAPAPFANQIDCEQGGVWRNCSQVDFGEILTRVRVNCTGGFVNASFNLTNIPDRYTFFYANATSSASGFLIYDNPDLTINDSGQFLLNATCYGAASQSSNSTNWNVSWGNISVRLVNPTTNANVNPLELFNFTVRVNCTGGECGNINVTLDPSSWWNYSWAYRTTINVSGVGSLLSDFQIEIDRNLTDLYNQGKLENDCSDIRFTNSTQIELSYWIESCNVNGSNSSFWVKVPSIAAAGNTTVYMYYGNPNVVNKSNATTTFDFYDPGNVVGNWTIAGTAGQTAAQGLPQPSYYATSNNGDYMFKNASLTTNRIIEYNSRSDGLGNLFFLTNNAGNGQHMRLETRGGNNAGIGSAASWTSWSVPSQTCANLATNTWFNFRLEIGATTAQAYIDDVACGGAFTFTNNGGYIGLVGDALGGAYTTWWDNIRVRKYSSTTPSYSLVGEEKGSKGITPMYSGIPFYTINQNPRDHINSSCLANMKSGTICDITWQVNATGDIGSFWDFFAFANNTNYLNYFNTSGSSSHINITIGNLPPSVPELNFPANATALTSIGEFNWSNSTDPTGDSIFYIIEISNVSNFSTIVYRNSSVPARPDPTGVVPSGITLEGTYYWRVRATDLKANSSWSETRVFYYDLYDPIVNLVFPGNLTTNLSSNTLDFVYNVSDTSNIPSCNLIINDSINDTSINITKNVNLTFTVFLSNSFYSWKVNCTDAAGRVGVSETRFLTIFAANNPPVAKEIQCEKNGIWYNCSSIGFGDNLTRARVKCTDIENGVTNATLNLTNVPDGSNYFYNITTTLAGGYWVLDNPDVIINDSGDFTLIATCTDNYGLSNSNSTTWTVPWGNLLVTLIDPSVDAFVMRNAFFTFSARVNCTGGECGNVNVTLDPANWWNDSWNDRKTVNITNFGATVLSNFTIYMNLTKESEMQNDFDDIRFVNGSCGSSAPTQLNYEIENYTSSKADVWIKIPSLATGINQICMYYGNQFAINGQNKAGVWNSNYKMVLHISEQGTGTRYDSTPNVNNGTPVNYDGIEHVTGKIDGADQILTDDYINTSYLQNSVTQYTISAWINTASTSGTIVQDRGSGAGQSLTFGIYPPCGGGGCTGASAGVPGLGVDSNSIWIGSYGTSRVDDGNWHYVVGVFNYTSGSITPSNFRIYVDGKYEAGSTGSTGSVSTPLTGLSGTKIGYHEAWAGNYFNGYIDEVTIATTAFSSDWINQSYQMIQNPNSTTSLGTREEKSKGIISTTIGAIPFYTTNKNPLNSSTLSCLGNMKSGNSCPVNWSVNATGAINSVWEFFVSANNMNYLNYFNNSADSSKIDITIASQLPPTVPQLYRPLNGSAYASIPNLNWTNSTDINGDKIYYILQVSNVSDFSTISFANYSIPETATPTGKTPTGITLQGAYYWRVRATDLTGNSSWSETRIFYYDLTAPNLTFINQTGEDSRIINFSNWLNRGENITIFVNSTDINVDKVWIIVWSTVVGGVEKVKTFFTYVGGFLWVAKVSTNQAWGGLYNYTIYTNDTLGSQVNYSSNFTVLGGNTTINLNPYSTNAIINITTYGHINLTNSSNLTNYPINIWLNGKLLFLYNLTGEGTYDISQEFQETSNAEFSQGTFYNTQVQNNANITLAPGETYGNYTKILDAGAMVSWNNLSWNLQGASCSGVFSYQEGDSNSYSGTRDTYITSGSATTNYGSSPDITIDGSPYNIRGLIKFDQVIGKAFNQIPENSTINNANLTFQISDAGDLVNVYEISENWTEAEATYNNRLTGTAWGSTGCSGSPSRLTTLEDSFVSPSLGAYTINVSSSMKDWTSGNSQNYGWVFDMPTSNGINIRSSDYSVQSERPLLMVDYQADECTNIIVYIRTSNDKITWTPWQQISNGGSINDSNVYSRYLQYKTELTSVNSALTPVLKDITVNYTAIVTDSYGNYRYNFTNPSQFGDYNITINTSLKTILINNSAILSVQTGVPPNVSLISPNNSQWFSSGNINLTYNATDVNNNLASAKLIVNGALNQTNATPITNYAYNNFTINFSSGQYNWTVNVTDTTGYETTTSQRTFYIDLINPNVSLLYPGNQSTYTVNQLNLSFNATDNMDTNLTCSIVVDGNTIRAGVGAVSGNMTNISSGTLSSGTHYWNVTCTDNAIRNFTSSTYNFNISDTPPNVTLVSPIPNYLDNDGNISFIYNASDNTGFTNCSLIINNTYRIWNQSAIVNYQNNTFDISGLSEGRQNWTVECFDLSATANKPSPRNFSVDLYSPQIALNSPSDTGTSISSRVYFNFTANDTFDNSLSCNLTINGVVMNMSNVTSGNLTTRQIGNLTDGLKYWNVTCIDDALHSNTSATWTVNITEAPSILLNTSNNSKYNQSSINLSYTPSDNTNLSICRLYLNGALNQSNSTAILNNQLNNFTINGIADGIYDWYVNCSDYFGISNQSQTRRIYIDHSPPQMNISYPAGSDVYASNVTFNFTVTDNFESNISCNLTVNSSVLDINFTTANGSMTSRTIPGIVEGYNLWNLTCWDTAGNINTSATFNFTKFTNPKVTLTFPDNNTWFNTSVITLFYLPEDDQGINLASLFINGVFNRTNSSPIINHGYNNFSITGFGDGIYYWNVNVTDPTGLTGLGAERRIYIDSQSPSLLLNYPNESSVVTTNNVTFNFIVSDNLANYISCNFTLDGELESSGVYSNNSNITKYAVIGDGNHSWEVDCVDNVSNFNNSVTINFTVKAPPIVTLNLPASNFRTTSSSVLFNYTPIDPIGIPNCSIYLDSIYNATKSDILIYTNQTGRLNNFTINGIAEGMHNWTVNCTDSDNNNYGPDPRIFYRDLSPPLIFLELPTNNSGIDYNKDRIYFNWTGIDVLDTTLQCNLTIDGVVRQPNVWVTGNISTSKYVLTSLIGQGEHSWNVTCWDQLKNSNTSELRKFNLTYPDFSINSSDIVINETSPKENQSVVINATIHNLAGADIENITVSIYNGDPDTGGTKIGGDIFINLSKFNQTTISQNWIAQIGASQIFVLVDPPLATNGSFKELNESNNKAGQSFNVGSWQFFYGDVLAFSDAVLANSNSSKLISWAGDGFDKGNVYVTDYDSYVSWASLQAIGKTKSNTTSSSDFAEIDSALNSSSYADSVYSVYTNSGTPKEKLSLLSFGKIIQDVPVVNSTNNSNFVTGILWDMSDDVAGGEFDSSDKEDLVFAALINKSVLGTYGTYDYEIRVPAKLRAYKSGNSKAVSFYVELS